MNNLPPPSFSFLQFATFDQSYKFLIELVLRDGFDLPEQNCREVFGVAYQLDTPSVRKELLAVTNIPTDWIKEELAERISGQPINPGTAWRQWPEAFLPRLSSGRFAYTYAERMYHQLSNLVSLLRTNPTTRRAILSIWDPKLDSGNHSEVPCTIMSQYALRAGSLNSIYYTRSNDCISFLVADVYLYIAIQVWLVDQLGCKLGTFSHIIGSLHIYDKDLEQAKVLLKHLEGET